MFERVQSLFAIPTAHAREATRIWKDDFTGEGIIWPMYGERWKPAFVAQWKKLLMQSSFVPTSIGLVGVEDVDFWKCMGPKLDPGHLQLVLLNAAHRGNVAIFAGLGAEHVRPYVQHHQMLVAAGRSDGLVHPAVVGFLRNAGYWGQHDVDALARTYWYVRNANMLFVSFGLDSNGFAGAPTPFVMDWIVNSLQHNGWGAHEQTQFMLNCLLHLPQSMWEASKNRIVQALHPQIDVPLLCLVGGYTADFLRTIEDEGDEARLVHSTVSQVSSHFVGNESWRKQCLYRSSAPTAPLSLQSGHPGLNVVLELMDTKVLQPMDLYSLAHQVKTWNMAPKELGFALPDLHL